MRFIKKCCNAYLSELLHQIKYVKYTQLDQKKLKGADTIAKKHTYN